jgi:hypothetical protein
MKFICLNPDCKKLFHYAAKKIAYNHFFPKAGDLTIPPILSDQMETLVCPFCHSLVFTEYIEEQKTEAKMVDMQDIEVAQVKEYLEKGYVVLDRYAKAIRMAFYEKPAEEAKP